MRSVQEDIALLCAPMLFLEQLQPFIIEITIQKHVLLVLAVVKIILEIILLLIA